MNKKKLIIFIIVGVLVAGAFFVYFNFLQPKPEETAEEQQKTTLEETYYYIPGDYFVTNIEGSQSLTKTSIALALTGEDQTAFLEKNVAVIRNCVIQVLRNHTEEELREPTSVDTLGTEMTESVKQALALEDLQNVYISDFVIQ